MIPVLIVPVYRRWDLARRMLDSLDVPARVVVVDNSQIGMRGDFEAIRPISNLGFAGAINTAIRQTSEAEWWMWASQDIAFAPGDLANIAALIGDARGPRVVTGDRSDDRLLRFAYAAVNRDCIETIGLLDEDSFWPGYFDDDDYEYRCRLGGVSWITYNGGISHDRSALIRSDATAAAGNARTFPENAQRYAAKWGGPPGRETFARPWNKPYPLSYAPVDIAGRARRAWK